VVLAPVDAHDAAVAGSGRLIPIVTSPREVATPMRADDELLDRHADMLRSQVEQRAARFGRHPAHRPAIALDRIGAAGPALVGGDVRATHDEAGLVVRDVELVAHHLPERGARALAAVGLAVPGKAMDARLQVAQIQGAHRQAVSILDGQGHVVGTAGQFDTPQSGATRQHQRGARHENVPSNHRCRLECLAADAALHQGFQRRVEALDAVHGANLRHLRGNLGVVERIQGILVLQLRGQKRQETVLRLSHLGVRCACLGVDRIVDRLCAVATDGRGCHGGSFAYGYWPIARVLSSSDFVVLMISALVW